MRRLQRARGFSLVELMIALALFGLIASGAMALVMSSARSQAHAARVDVAQSGLRAALDFMTRDIMSACAGASTSLWVGSTNAAQNCIVITDNATGANTPDTIEIWGIDGTAQTGSPAVPVILTVAAASGSSSYTVTDATVFKSTDMVMLSDLVHGTLVQLNSASGTSIGSSATNTFATGVTYPIPPTATSYVFRVRHTTYSVLGNEYGSGTASGNGSALMVDLHDGAGAQPLADGVEDLQFALGYDSNPTDGMISTTESATAGADEWVFNVNGEFAPATMVNVKAVRVTIVAKSTTQEKGTFPARPLAENHPAGTADGFFRRVIRSEIAIRNFNL